MELDWESDGVLGEVDDPMEWGLGLELTDGESESQSEEDSSTASDEHGSQPGVGMWSWRGSGLWLMQLFTAFLLFSAGTGR